MEKLPERINRYLKKNKRIPLKILQEYGIYLNSLKKSEVIELIDEDLSPVCFDEKIVNNYETDRPS